MTAAPTPVPARAGRWGRCIPEQAEVRAFLERLAGRPPIQTQISAVFVGDDTVWKLKRAVRLSFLDFTALDARRRFLQRELEVNAPAAPGLYRDVVPVTRAADELVLGGPGEVVDWVLRMARVPEADFLDVGTERLDAALLDALGDMVAASHASLPAAAVSDPASAVRQNVLGNAQAALAAGLPPDQVAAWRDAALAAFDRLGGVLADRAAAGLVRRAHGDLHLGNICLWQGRPVPFDAIEFDEAMATIDLGYDLAFLLMDLDHRVGRAAANRVLNRYVARTGDAELVRLLPPFLSRRAMVRAHVRGGAEGLAYLDAAWRYIHPSPGCVVAIGGLPGSGKSTLARALAPDLGPAPGALILRSDEIRKRLHGVAPEAQLGPDAYTPSASARVEAVLLDGVRAAAGHAVIADATFLDPARRRAIGAAGAPFIGIWLDAPVDELERRVAARKGDASDATLAVLHRLAAVDPGPMTWHRIPSDQNAAGRCRTLLRECLGAEE
jgi:aminoglycoside phosphotransferase family enzyme/predicted kinase